MAELLDLQVAHPPSFADIVETVLDPELQKVLILGPVALLYDAGTVQEF